MKNNTKLLETDRLILRQMQENDFDDFIEYFTEPSINRFLGGFMPMDVDGARIIFLANCKLSYTWAIEEKSSGKVIGDIHFGNMISGYLTNIGYVINKNFWGMGFAKEAIDTIVDYGFTELDLGRVRAITQKDNIRSRNVLKKCGFKEEALIIDGDFNGRIDDIYYYSIYKYDKFRLN